MSAFRLAADCPLCRAHLVRRERRSDGNPFVSCSAYPRCNFAEGWDDRVNELAERIVELESERDVQQSVERDLRRRLENATAQVKTWIGSPASLLGDRDLRDMIAIAHPDRWHGRPATELAHEIVTRLNSMRSNRPRTN